MFATYNRLNLPVWATSREVIHAARKRLKPSSRKGRECREGRHSFYRAMLREHRDARALYHAVVGGHI